MNEKLLAAYARLVARVGINVQKGQTIVLNCPIDCAPFGRLIVEAAYDAGAKDVIVHWKDDFCSRQRWLRADDSLFDSLYPWEASESTELAKGGAGFISVAASDPENLAGVDPERLRRQELAVGRELKTYYKMMMSNAVPWCVVSVPVTNWARKVFPGQPDVEATDKLWKAILAAVRVTEGGDAVRAWQEHCERLGQIARKMTELRLTQLHYQNALGTDLVVGMPEGHCWLAGADTTAGGVRFVANMPTEEVFSAPKRDAVNGVVVASRPLVLNGNIVEGIRLTLRDGRIVEARADRGEDVLRKAIDTDEGAHYLGEIALVPADSPIAESGLLFYNTLFDENAACHFAFGEAYPGCIEGGDGMQTQELMERGINAESNMHVDFMVGTDDLTITGQAADGREVVVFRDGRFAL